MRLGRLKILPAGIVLLIALSACAAPQKPASTAPLPEPAPPHASAEVLLTTGETILGQPIVYPTDSPAQVTIAIVTLEPGASTGWHRHAVPLAAYMLDGELTVTYEGEGKRVYRAGDALVEAMVTPHNGRNAGSETVRILAVFAGAEGVANSEAVD
ncbi:MAG: cupin domain-containing protein [Rhodovibrionaceae bacterium]